MSEQVVVPDNEPAAPDYLVALHIALNELNSQRASSKLEARRASIAITDLEKLIAYITLYVTAS
jgi:hypothetical protein